MRPVRTIGRWRWLTLSLAALLAMPVGVVADPPDWMRPQKASQPAKKSSAGSKPQSRSNNQPSRRAQQGPKAPSRSGEARPQSNRSNQVRRESRPARAERPALHGPLPPRTTTVRPPARTQTVRPREPQARSEPQLVGPLPPRSTSRPSRPTARDQRPVWLDVDRNRGGNDRNDRDRQDRDRNDRDRGNNDRGDRGQGDRDRDRNDRDHRGGDHRGDWNDRSWRDHDRRDDHDRDRRRHFDRSRSKFGIDWHRPYYSHPFYPSYRYPRYTYDYYPRYRTHLYLGTGAIFDDCDPYWGTYSWTDPYYSRDRIYIYNSPWSSPSYGSSVVTTYSDTSYDPAWGSMTSTGEAIRRQQEADAAMSEADRYQVEATEAESRSLRINEAWTALAEGRPSMATFADLLTSEPQVALHRVGYAIGAARSKQAERAEWAILSALEIDPGAVAQVPAGARDAAKHAVEEYREAARAGREAGVTLAALLMAAGDAPAAAEALSALDPADTLVDGLRRVVVAELGREP